MKLKTLAITVAVLGGLAGAAWWSQRPTEVTGSVVTPGSKLVSPAIAGKLARLELYAEAAAPVVELEKSGANWSVINAQGMPADFNKLASFVQSLVDAKVNRDTGSNAEVLARMELNKNRVVFKDAAGAVLLELKLGKTAPGSGTFAQRSGEPFGLVTSFSFSLDTTPNNWVEKKIIATEAPKVKEFTVDFGNGQPALQFAREKEGDLFAGVNLPEGKAAKADEVNNALNAVLNARFDEPQTALDTPEVAGAKAHATTYTLKTFGGDTYTVALGRMPAPPAPPAPIPEPAAAGAEGQPPAESPAPAAPAPQPGPAYGFYTVSNPSSPWQSVLPKVALKFADYYFNNLPENADKLMVEKSQ
ncbi:MAG: DUF4340 domain-containing protein [Verrucomicrobiota bacterium]|nr:DUF4340 domain-containing protein [Verrucomicrobiota bacterium]